MRRAAVLAAWVAGCWAAVGCAPSGPTKATGVTPADARLGTVVFQTDERETGYGDWLSWAPVQRGAVLPTSDGLTHVALALAPGRQFGGTAVALHAAAYRVVAANGTVSDGPTPPLGVDEAGTLGFVASVDGERPTLLERAPATARFDYARVHVLADGAWRTQSFGRFDRAAADREDTATAALQLRPLSATELLVQHGDTLRRRDGSGWHDVPLPAGAREVRLGQADATRVRVFWTTGTEVRTDVLLRDGWSWAGRLALWQQAGAAFSAGFGHAGTVDAFTLAFGVPTGGVPDVVTLRLDGARFVQAERRPLVLDSTSWMSTVSHPTRGVLVQGEQLQGLYRGKATGSLGVVVAKPQVSCPNTCPVDAGLVGTAAQCAACVPRSVSLVSWRETLAVDGVLALFADTTLDANVRYYLKRIAFPWSAESVQSDAAPTAFPGDDGSSESPDGGSGLNPDQVLVHGRVLLPGLTDHSGTRVVLATPTATLATVMTDATGSYVCPAVAKAALTVTLTHAGYRPVTVRLTAADAGDQQLDRVLSSASLVPTTFPTTGKILGLESGLLIADGGTLTQVAVQPTGTASSFTLSTDLTPGTFPRVLGAQQAVFAWTEGACPACAIHTSEAPGQALAASVTLDSLRAVGGHVAWAEGAPDGHTLLGWKAFGSSGPGVLLSAAADVQGERGDATVLLAWESSTTGLHARAATLGTPAGVITGAVSAEDVPVLSEVQGNGMVAGFQGAGCGASGGYATPCPLWALPRPNGLPTVLSLSSAAVAFTVQRLPNGLSRVTWLERAGAQATVKARSSALEPVATLGTVTLPTSWAADEAPLVGLDFSATTLVRTESGVSASAGNAGDLAALLPGVVRVVAVPQDPASTTPQRAVLYVDDGQGPSCANGCALSVVRGATAPVSLGVRGNGGEVFRPGGLLTDATPWSETGAPLRLVTQVSWTGVKVLLAAGRLFPDRTQPVVSGVWHRRTGVPLLVLEGGEQATVNF